MLWMSVQAVQWVLIKDASAIIFTFTLRYDKRDPPPSSMVLAIRAYLLSQFGRELMSKAFPKRFYRQIHILYFLTSYNHRISPKNATCFTFRTTWVCRNLEDNKILASRHKKFWREEWAWQKGSDLKGEQLSGQRRTTCINQQVLDFFFFSHLPNFPNYLVKRKRIGLEPISLEKSPSYHRGSRTSSRSIVSYQAPKTLKSSGYRILRQTKIIMGD